MRNCTQKGDFPVEILEFPLHLGMTINNEIYEFLDTFKQLNWKFKQVEKDWRLNKQLNIEMKQIYLRFK